MISTQLPPNTGNEQLKEDKKTGAFQREVTDRFSANATAQCLLITLLYIWYCTRSNLFTLVPVKFQ